MRFILIFIAAIVFSSAPLYSQFLNIEIPVKTESSADIHQKLTFNTFQPGTGLHKISVTDKTAGVYSMISYANQLVSVTVSKAVFLKHISHQDSIKLNIVAAYCNAGVNDPQKCIPFKNNKAFFKIYQSPAAEAFWKTAYIYLYGSLNIGDVHEGLFRGEVALRISYW